MPSQTDILSTQLGGIANLALLAPIRPGFVDRYESVTYAKRLESLLKTVNAIRLAARESSMIKSPFPDTVGRTGILHSFRYAIVPPALGSSGEPARAGHDPQPGVYRLSLNVTFDGGWEPYIRVIHRDLGPLLDAIFCNCTGYPVTRLHGFHEYTRWVRDHEIPGGLFYTESSMTVLDERYLAGVEKIARAQEGGLTKANLARASFALKDEPDMRASLAAFAAEDEALQKATLTLHLRALKGLNDLTTLYPENADRDDLTLLRFAQSALPEVRAVLPSPASPSFPEALKPHAASIAWLKSELPAPAPRERAVALEHNQTAARIQAGIVSRYDGVTHGCIALLRVTDAAEARKFLSTLPVSREGKPLDDIQCNVALTLQGLKALGVPKWRIDMFPHEFLEGMEARAGLLGDVRNNHPDNWRRPRIGDPASKHELDLGAVHVVLQYRYAEPDASKQGPDLHPRLQAKLDELGKTMKGLRLLATEAMCSYPDPAMPGISREHFGYRDGLSQPEISNDKRQAGAEFKWDDKVPRGEIFLGYANDRGDGPYPPCEDLLFDDGTFLALRKIRQRTDRLDPLLRAAAEARESKHRDEDAATYEARIAQVILELRTKLMGRSPDGGAPAAPQLGAPVSSNVYDYSKDPQGIQCPFHSHARRANPRDQLPLPRIFRRGMSYGPRATQAGKAPGHEAKVEAEVDRGIFFMAYCASIAEQFEVIQRWITGGNSSGGLSARSDPFLGVPQEGEARIFEYFDGEGTLRRMDLGSEPLTELQWGAYLFVPSLTALEKLQTIVDQKDKPDGGGKDVRTPGVDRGPAFDAWQQSIEDPNERKKVWQRVLDAPEDKLETPYGLLIAKPGPVLDALKDDGKALSVCGYGRRFEATLGPGYLGFDGKQHDKEAETPPGKGVNQAIADVSVEEAFAVALGATQAALAGFPSTPHQTRPGGFEKLVDLAILSELVLAGLCTHWFGLPDAGKKFMDDRRGMGKAAARCPGHFVSVSRYVFWPYPSDAETEEAKEHGGEIQQAVKAYLAAADSGKKDAPKLGPLSARIKERLAPLAKKDPDVVARNIAGVMLGFPPTVHLNFLRVMKAWVENHATTPSSTPKVSLWDLQADLLSEGAAGAAAPSGMLRKALLAQMREYPAPELVWREPPGSKGEHAHKTVIGLAAAMEAGGHDLLMFGGSRPSDDPELQALHTPHACPGYGMAMGVMLGMVTAILRAQGTLRPTASPTIVNIVT